MLLFFKEEKKKKKRKKEKKKKLVKNIFSTFWRVVKTIFAIKQNRDSVYDTEIRAIVHREMYAAIHSPLLLIWHVWFYAAVDHSRQKVHSFETVHSIFEETLELIFAIYCFQEP